MHVSFQGTIHGSSGLGFNVQKILTEEAHMNLCMWDRKAFWMYNGPPAASLDEVMTHGKAGRLEGKTARGIPLGWIFISVHMLMTSRAVLHPRSSYSSSGWS